MSISDLFYALTRCILIIALTAWLFVEVSRIPSPEVAKMREQQWASFEQQAQAIHSPEAPRSIVANAQRLLQSRPLDNRSLRLLAFSAEKQKNYHQAKRLMQLAVERSKADAIANTWLLEAHLTDGNWDAALTHFDAAFRVYGPLQRQLSPAIHFLVRSSTAADTLSKGLKENPPWSKSLHSALQKAQAAASSTRAKSDKPRIPADQPNPSTSPQIVHDVLRTMGANRENNRCAAAVEGRPPRSKSDRPCSGPPALFLSGPFHLE